jgi:hypothetical protein
VVQPLYGTLGVKGLISAEGMVLGNQGTNLKLASHAVYINKEPSVFDVPLALI